MLVDLLVVVGTRVLVLVELVDLVVGTRVVEVLVNVVGTPVMEVVFVVVPLEVLDVLVLVEKVENVAVSVVVRPGGQGTVAVAKPVVRSVLTTSPLYKVNV